MKIGFLHSFRTHLGNIANAKLYRIMYEDWNDDTYSEWMDAYYRQFTDRRKLGGLIYDYRPYYKEFADFNEYDLIALSLNFDIYPDDFHKFVYDIINDLYRNFPVLHQKEVIILAGNEVFEKRKSVEKVIQTCRDTKQGIDNSVKPNLPICAWNQKIYTSGEKSAFNKLLNDDLTKSICKYIGYQSLGTKSCDLATYIRYAKNLGYEPIDVELGHFSDKFGVVKELFDIGRTNQVKKVFILTPYISDKMTDENFKNYALQIGNKPKDKFKLVQYIQAFKDSEQESEVNEMWDDIIFRTLYRVGTRGIGVKRIQKIFNIWVKDYMVKASDYPIDEDGLFGEITKKSVEIYQMENILNIDGVAGSETLTSMFNFMLRRYDIKGEYREIKKI